MNIVNLTMFIKKALIIATLFLEMVVGAPLRGSRSLLQAGYRYFSDMNDIFSLLSFRIVLTFEVESCID